MSRMANGMPDNVVGRAIESIDPTRSLRPHVDALFFRPDRVLIRRNRKLCIEMQ
jgi:hypothetical protein